MSSSPNARLDGIAISDWECAITAWPYNDPVCCWRPLERIDQRTRWMSPFGILERVASISLISTARVFESLLATMSNVCLVPKAATVADSLLGSSTV
jgi:hypothetical protein